MDELGRDQFPKECWGCYENCYSCTRKIGSASVPVIRDFVALKMLKQQAIVRMRRMPVPTSEISGQGCM